VNDPVAGFLSYKHKKATKDFFIVRAGTGDQCSIEQGEFSDKPVGANWRRPVRKQGICRGCTQKLAECEGGRAADSEGKKHGKKNEASFRARDAVPASGARVGSMLHRDGK
jgi:hypothetical protein